MNNNFFNCLTSSYLNELYANNNRFIIQNFLNSFVNPEKSINSNSPFKFFNGEAVDGTNALRNLEFEEKNKILDTISLTNLKEAGKNEEVSKNNTNLVFKIELPSDFLENKKNSNLDTKMKNEKEDSKYSTLGLLSKKFKCDYKHCDKSFAKKILLKDHKKKFHNHTFTCTHENCKSSFRYMENLVKHQQLHEKKTYTCSYTNCDKSFSIFFNLKVNHINNI